MICFSRILLLLVFAVYWGGLTFYTGVVVRISHDVLNDPMDGGLITQRVTVVLQMLGLVVALLMILNGLIVVRKARRYGFALFICAAVLSCSLAGLYSVHQDLDSVIDVAEGVITDREEFTIGHRRYNQLTTVQWLACLTYLPIAVFTWRSIDAGIATRMTSASGNATSS